MTTDRSSRCRTCEHSESEHEQHPLLWLCRRCDCTTRPEATERGVP